MSGPTSSAFRRFLIKTSNLPSRPYSTKLPPPKTSIDRINARLPRFLHRYTVPLKSAPVSHITAFLLLHELTAVVPLFGFAAAFHYFDWLPSSFVNNTYVTEGSEKFGRYLRKKGWVGQESEDREGGGGEEMYAKEARYEGEQGVKVVLEFATAFAVTKVLLPLRLVMSVWATPWFARLSVVPIFGIARRMFGRRAVKTAASPAAGAGSVGGGVVPAARGIPTSVKAKGGNGGWGTDH